LIPFAFRIAARDAGTRARAGVLQTPHGLVETPLFMPVGTRGTVKGLAPRDLSEAGAQIILANAYHLSLRPGAEQLAAFGGLHRFMGWSGPLLTDSGGFQLFSLATPDRRHGSQGSLVKVTDDGAWFTSPLDGSRQYISPERSMEIQQAIGADIIMAFDECSRNDDDVAVAALSMQRTHVWLVRLPATLAGAGSWQAKRAASGTLRHRAGRQQPGAARAERRFCRLAGLAGHRPWRRVGSAIPGP